jgi:hypothetical protein
MSPDAKLMFLSGATWRWGSGAASVAWVVTGGRRPNLKNRLVAAALAAGFALSGAAHAQVQADDGMTCVYEALVDDYELVAEVLIYGDLSEEEGAASDKAVETAKATCAAKHNYTPGQRDAAGELGVLASALDYLSEELMFSGVSDAALDGVLDAYDTFTDEDLDVLFDPDWRSDMVFLGEMKAKMLSAGIPDEADLMDIALTILEITAMVEEVSYMFVLEEDAQ